LRVSPEGVRRMDAPNKVTRDPCNGDRKPLTLYFANHINPRQGINP